MPTAVERALEKFFDEFLGRKFTPNEGLNSAVAKIDGDIAALSHANAANFLKIEHDGGLRHDLTAIGDAFVTVGNDFQKAETGGEIINGLIGLLFGSGGGGGAGAGLQVEAESADHKLGTTAADLKAFGGLFLKIEESRTLEQFNVKLAGLADGSVRLADDMTADHDAFQRLGADFLKLGGDSNALLPAVFKELGGDLQKVAGDFASLSNDFLTLGDALHGSGGGGGAGRPGDTTAAGGGGGAGGPVGTALGAVMQDFHFLSVDGGAVAHDAAVLVSDLIQQSFAPNTNHPNDHGNH